MRSNLSDLENEAVDLITSKDSLLLYNSKTELFLWNSEAPPNTVSGYQTASPDSPILLRAHNLQYACMHACVCVSFIHLDPVFQLCVRLW